MNTYALVKYCRVVLWFSTICSVTAMAAPGNGIDEDVATVINTAKSLIFDDPQLSLSMFDSLLSVNTLTQRELTEVHYQKGRLYYLGFLEKDKAILSFYQALRHSKNTEDVNRQNGILSFLGLSYKELNHYEYALEYYREALALEQVETKRQLMTLYNYGKTLRLDEQFDSAIIVQKQLIQEFDRLEMSNQVIESRLALGATYINMKAWDSAEETYKDLQVEAENEGDSTLMVKVLSSLGAAYAGRDQLDVAKRYFEDALSLMTAQVDQQTLLVTFNNLGIIARKEGKDLVAREFWKQSAELDSRLVNLALQIGNIQGIIEISEARGDTETAFVYSSRLNEMVVPIAETQKSMEELHTRYLAEKIRTEIEAFELKESLTIAQLRIWFIASVLSLLLVIGALVYWILKKRQKLDDSVIEHLKQRDQLLYYISYRYHLDVPSMMREMHGDEKLAG